MSEKHGKYGNVAEFSGNISEHTNKHPHFPNIRSVILRDTNTQTDAHTDTQTHALISKMSAGGRRRRGRDK